MWEASCLGPMSCWPGFGFTMLQFQWLCERNLWVGLLPAAQKFGTAAPLQSMEVAQRKTTAQSQQGWSAYLAVGPNQWYHFGVGAPPILVYFSRDCVVHREYEILTHGHLLPGSNIAATDKVKPRKAGGFLPPGSLSWEIGSTPPFLVYGLVRF